MIKEVYAQCNFEYLIKLYETYVKIGDTKDILNIAGRILQCEDEVVDKTLLIDIFDKIYEIFKPIRKNCRDIMEIEGQEKEREHKKRVKYIKEYKSKYFSDLSQVLAKFTNDISKGVIINHTRNKEIEAFLQFCYADYKRYQCEVTLDQETKEELLKETDKAYNDYFELLKEGNVCLVSPAYLAGNYHYSIFLFEVKEDKVGAIRYLKNERFKAIDLLDTVFKNFTESYELISTITETLTNWVILTNYKDEEEE
jgi:hypothetical protein